MGVVFQKWILPDTSCREERMGTTLQKAVWRRA